MPSARHSTIIALIVVDLAFILVALGNPVAFSGIMLLNILAFLVWLIIWRPGHKVKSRYQSTLEARSIPERHEYGTRCVTLHGEIVKSKGEERLADFLFQIGIRYRYEPRVYAYPKSDRYRRSSHGRIIGRPDFLLTDYNILVEYWGMASVPDPIDRANYQKKMAEKKNLYHQNGYKLISFYSTDLDNLDSEFRRQFVDLTGFAPDQT